MAGVRYNTVSRYCDSCVFSIFEPSHEIIVLFVLRKLILQTRMRSDSVGLDVWLLVGLFIYFHTSCVQTAKGLARLRRCPSSPEPSLVAYVISTKISWAGSFLIEQIHVEALSISCDEKNCSPVFMLNFIHLCHTQMPLLEIQNTLQISSNIYLTA